MKYDELSEYFDGDMKRMCQYFDVFPQTLHYWKHGGIPIGRQYEIEVRTNGELKADRENNNESNG